MQNSQEVANTIKNFAKSKKILIGKMLSDCDLSVNTLSSMQSGGYYPRLEAITKIADYLDCSVDYLLGRTDVPEINKGNVINVEFAAQSGKEYNSQTTSFEDEVALAEKTENKRQ